MKTAPTKLAALKHLRTAAAILTHYEGSDAADTVAMLKDLAAQLELDALTPKS